MTAKHARLPYPPAPTSPAISVCMIVRNEASELRECLAPLDRLAHEIIVVDTGSTDSTVELARSLGAQVYHFTWINDFAAARNESIRHATGEWVFWLDADDRLDAAAVTGLKQAAAASAGDAYICAVRSAVQGGADELTEHIRMFRNHRGITFCGRIHETVMGSVTALGLKLERLNVEIKHTGYGNMTTIESKSKRNLAIVESALAADPENLDLLFYRSQSRFNLSQRAETRGDLEKFLTGSRLRSRYDTRRIWAYGMLLRILDEAAEAAAFEAVLTNALEDFPGQTYFLALRARLDLTAEQPDLALRRLGQAEANLSKVRGFSPSPAWLAETRSECCLGAHDYVGARAAARAALDHNPQSVKATCLLITADIMEGRLAQAEAALEPLLTGPAVEPWVTVFDLRLAQGRFDEARVAVDEAVARRLDATRAGRFYARLTAGAQDVARSLHGPMQRGIACLAIDDYLAAAQAFASAVEEAPTDPQGYRYLAVALKSLGEDDQALEAWQLAQHWQSLAQAVA